MKITTLVYTLFISLFLLSSCKNDNSATIEDNNTDKVAVAKEDTTKPTTSKNKVNSAEKKQAKRAPKKDRPVRKTAAQKKIDKKYEAMASALSFLTEEQISELKKAEIGQKERLKNANGADDRKAINKEMVTVKRNIVTNKNYKKLLEFEKSYRKK